MKVKLSATIPTVQYGNIMPEFEVEADTLEEGLAIVEPQLVSTWNKYVEEGKQLNTSKGKLIKCFVGGDIYYDDVTHTYTNEAGEVYLSSSQHAAKFAKPFDKQGIAANTAKKYGVSADDVITMWDLKSKISRDLGTALHEAIELRRRFETLSKTMGKETHVHLSPMLKVAVDELMQLIPPSEEEIEAVVVDHKTKRVGRIDLLTITAPETCIVRDFKTGDIDKSLAQYWEQLKFTTEILEANGWKVTGREIYHWNGTWKLIKPE